MIPVRIDLLGPLRRISRGSFTKDHNIMAMIAYFRARFAERSTWAAISAAVVGAAAVAAPFSYILIAAGVMGALVPSPKGAE